MKTLADDVPNAGEKRVAERRAVTETRSVLAKASAAWANHSCPGTSECCQLTKTGRPPWLWPSEWLVLLERLKRDGRPIPGPRDDDGCSLLSADGMRCTVYEDRPFGCRTFFCHRIIGPRQIPADDTNHLLERLAAINIALDERAEVKSLPELLKTVQS